MVTGLQLVQAGKVFEGEPYSTAGGRTSPDSGFKDCSGFTYATHLVATGQPFPNGATVSTAQEIACREGGGRELTRDEATQMPGAICFIWGYGPKGHVELVSDRPGFTYGTPSDLYDPEFHDVGYSPWDDNAWTSYWTIPGIDYGQAAPPGPSTKETRDMGAVYEDPGGQWWFCRGPVRTIIASASAEVRVQYLFILVGTKQVANPEVPKVSWEFLHLWREQKRNDGQ